MIGAIINERYKIKELIGEGGMATVYLATDLILTRDVAVKLMRSDLASSDDYIRRFNREGYAASSLTHPNIVSILDVGKEHGNYFIVMEYIGGMTLKEYIQKFAPIPMEKVVDIMRQLTSALAHAHGNQVVHRDIKPQNILINQSGDVKIADFGIATAVSAATLTQTNTELLGSVHYMSPEQAKGGFTSHKSDIYSLGVVMFELLTGHQPFSGDSAVSVALQHLQSELPSAKMWNPSIPQSVENVVLRATAKNPNHRYFSTEDMREDLETVLEMNRLNERKYTEPQDTYDEEATKAVPPIREEQHQPLKQPQSKARPDQDQDKDAKIDPKKAVAGKKPKRKLSRKMKIILGLLGVGLLILLYLFLFTNVFASGEVEVPDVSGKVLEEAKKEIENAGLRIAEEPIPIQPDEEEEEQFEPGQVVRTDPEAGTSRKRNSEVYVYYIPEEDEETVISYVGKNYPSIEAELRETFKDVVVKEEEGNGEVGTITSQDPAPGTKVKLDDTVLTVTIVKEVEKEEPEPDSEPNPEPTRVQLRDLTGFTRQQLDTYQSESGFNITRSEAFSDRPEGTVVSQSPAPGNYAPGTTVSVVISKGKEPAPDPQPVEKRVTRDFPINYTGEDGAEQVVQIFVTDKNNRNALVKTMTIVSNVRETVTLVLDEGGTPGRVRILRDGQEIINDGGIRP